MPKVIHTNAKGLVQSTGSGFKVADFLSRNEDNFGGTAVSVSDAEARAATVGTPGAAAILAATLTDDAMNDTAFAGASGAAAIFLPAANAGAYLGVKFTADPSSTNDLVIHASHATYQSASEAARQAAGGTAAVFAKGIIAGHPSGRLASQTSSGAHVKLTIDMDGTNNFHAQNSALYFFCPEDGKWLVGFEGDIKGTGSAATFG